MPAIGQLGRNDLEAAKAFYADHAPITPGEMEILLMLQDDPSELLKLSRTWVVHQPDELKSEWERVLDS